MELNILLGALLVLYVAFFVWMLVDMLNARKLSKQMKGVWFLLFFGTGIAPIVWYFVRK